MVCGPLSILRVEGREGEEREGKGREGKGRAGQGRAGQGRAGTSEVGGTGHRAIVKPARFTPSMKTPQLCMVEWL